MMPSLKKKVDKKKGPKLPKGIILEIIIFLADKFKIVLKT